MIVGQRQEERGRRRLPDRPMVDTSLGRRAWAGKNLEAGERAARHHPPPPRRPSDLFHCWLPFFLPDIFPDLVCPRRCPSVRQCKKPVPGPPLFISLVQWRRANFSSSHPTVKMLLRLLGGDFFVGSKYRTFSLLLFYLQKFCTKRNC